MRELEGSVHEIRLLDDGEADGVWAKVHDLRSDWVERHDELPFFTLGAASYLDATNGRFADYQAKARCFNPLLREHFGWLLDRLAQRFSEHVGRTAFYDQRLALPGFHVFLAHPAFASNTASVHYDLQYQGIDWTEVGAASADEQRSLTLAIRSLPRAPVSGSGTSTPAIWPGSTRMRSGTGAPRTVARRGSVTRWGRSSCTPVTTCTRSRRSRTSGPMTNGSRCRRTGCRSAIAGFSTGERHAGAAGVTMRVRIALDRSHPGRAPGRKR